MVSTYLITTEDLVKYPFLPEATERIRRLNLSLREVLSLRDVVERAIRRATSRNYIIDLTDPDTELLSFYLSLVLVALTRDSVAIRKFADIESKRVSKFLQQESLDKVVYIAKKAFNIDVQVVNGLIQVHFVHYLRYMPQGDLEWKLVNRVLHRGFVYLSLRELTRLLEEAYEKWILSKCNEIVNSVIAFPEEITSIVDELRSKLRTASSEITVRRRRLEGVIDPYPPCIRKLIEEARAGENLSHIARFTLASFLLHIGLSVDEVVKYFENLPDYDEKKTRYQVEHIAGLRGSRKKYLPPSCDYLRSVGLCPGECIKGIHHPLQYYRLATRSRASEGGVGSEQRAEAT